MSYIDDFVGHNAGTMTRDQIVTSLRAAGYSESEITAALRRGPKAAASDAVEPPEIAGWAQLAPQAAGGIDDAATAARPGKGLRLWVGAWTGIGVILSVLAVIGAATTGDLAPAVWSAVWAMAWGGIGLVLYSRAGAWRVLAAGAPVVLLVGTTLFVSIIEGLLDILGVR